MIGIPATPDNADIVMGMCRVCNLRQPLAGAYRVGAAPHSYLDEPGPWYWACLRCLRTKVGKSLVHQPYEFNDKAIMALIMEE
jgi:hypothetical protein